MNKTETAQQLPPPPPEMKWRREDGWKEDDLPQGYRPHIFGEIDQKGDEIKKTDGWAECACRTEIGSRAIDFHRRTTLPLTFTHEGKLWTWHRPGDPMPCDGEARIDIVCDTGKSTTDDGDPLIPRTARHNKWDANAWEPCSKEVQA